MPKLEKIVNKNKIISYPQRSSLDNRSNVWPSNWCQLTEADDGDADGGRVGEAAQRVGGNHLRVLIWKLTKKSKYFELSTNWPVLMVQNIFTCSPTFWNRK
jgi:hypothetical protein